jgi:hypothetical protein
MGRRGFSPQQIESARQRAAGGVYEDPAHCTNVSVDDVGVKKQKVHQVHRERAAAKPGGSASVVVCRIEQIRLNDNGGAWLISIVTLGSNQNHIASIHFHFSRSEAFSIKSSTFCSSALWLTSKDWRRASATRSFANRN